MNDVVIYVKDGTLYSKSLASASAGAADLTIPVSRSGRDAVSAVTYDYENKCIYWVDTSLNAIQVNEFKTSFRLVLVFTLSFTKALPNGM